MEEEDEYVKTHLPPPKTKKRDLETLAAKKNEQKKQRIKRAFAIKNIKASVKEIPVAGPGPWKVFMLVNVFANEATKKQVEIRLHTYPELVANIKNTMDQGAWVIVAKMGDFYVYEDALQVFSEWSENTRGPIPRLAKALVLWERYRQFGVTLYFTRHTREEIRAIISARDADTATQGAITVKEALTGPVSASQNKRASGPGGGGGGGGRRKRAVAVKKELQPPPPQ